MFRSFALDARHLWRSLRRSPAFTALTVAMLAGGIAVTTTVASILDHVVLRGLPYRDSGRPTKLASLAALRR